MKQIAVGITDDGAQCPFCIEVVTFDEVGRDDSVGMHGDLVVQEGFCMHYKGMNDDQDKVMFELTKEECVGNYGPYDPDCEECDEGQVSSTIGGDGYAEVDQEGPCMYCTEEGIRYRRESEMQYLPRRMWSEDWTKQGWINLETRAHKEKRDKKRGEK